MAKVFKTMNEELKQIFDEDQADRLNNPNPTQEYWREIFEKDRVRRKAVQEMIDKGELKDPEDFVHAAFVFQHGEKPEDYLKANQLAKQAIDMGYDKAKWIYAASLDRYLLETGNPQKFGTQYKVDEDGNWILSEIDPNTTDEERVEYFIKPLAEIKKIKPPQIND